MGFKGGVSSGLNMKKTILLFMAVLSLTFSSQAQGAFKTDILRVSDEIRNCGKTYLSGDTYVYNATLTITDQLLGNAITLNNCTASITALGTGTFGADTDIIFTAGRWRAGYDATFGVDAAILAHYDMFDNTNFALAQDNSGDTWLNSGHFTYFMADGVYFGRMYTSGGEDIFHLISDVTLALGGNWGSERVMITQSGTNPTLLDIDTGYSNLRLDFHGNIEAEHVGVDGLCSRGDISTVDDLYVGDNLYASDIYSTTGSITGTLGAGETTLDRLGVHTSPNAVSTIYTREIFTLTSGGRNGIFADPELQPSGALVDITTIHGALLQGHWDTIINGSVYGYIYGAQGTAHLDYVTGGGSGDLLSAIGLWGRVRHRSDGDLTTAIGVLSHIQQDDSSTELGGITSAYNFLARATTDKTALIVNRYGLYIEDTTGGGGLTNQYGIYCPALTGGGTTNLFIKNVSADSDFGSGDIETTGDLTVTGSTELASLGVDGLCSRGKISLVDDLFVGGNAYLTGDLAVNGGNITSTATIAIKPSGDSDDYLAFLTVANIAYMLPNNDSTHRIGGSTSVFAEGWFDEIACDGDLTLDPGSGSIIVDGSLTATNLTLSGASILANAAASGVLTLGGTGGTNDENLTFDFETTANEIGIDSGTSAICVFDDEIKCGGASAGMSVIASGLTVNDDSGGGANDDFIAETDSSATAFQVDASANLIYFNVPIGDKIAFTQTDGNEYIDSLNDGYMDYGATTGHRFNSAGGDVTLFEDTNVGNDDDGKSLYIHRKAEEGDVYLKLHVNQWGTAVAYSDVDFQIGCNGDVYFVTNPSIGLYQEKNLTFKHVGYITAVTADKYIQWQVNDTTDCFELTREDTNILAFDIQMPTHIGDGTNETMFAADGTQTMAGTARVIKSRWFPFNALKAPGTKPATFKEWGISGVWEFTDGTDDTIVFNLQIPNDMDLTVAPTFNIGWSTHTAVTTETCTWQLEYLYTAAGEDTTAAAQDTETVDSNAVAQADGMIVAEITGMDLPGATDVCMHCRLKRLGAGGNDDLTDTAELHGICIKYTSNSFGEDIP